jgi:hypothetical protein
MTDSALASATYVVPGALAWQPHHNDALNRLEQLAQITVVDRTTTSAPAAPAQGTAYIVASAATGDWSTRVDQVAAYYSGWAYLNPREGWKAYDQGANRSLVFDGSIWQIDRTGLFKTTAYTAGATWVKDPATIAVRVRLVAGGGGGGKGTAAAKTGGGGAGEYAEGYFDSGVGASETVTIGAGGAGSTGANGGNGGTTSFGSLLTALGGVASGDDLTVGALGGTGGTGGDFHAAGGNGGGGQNSDDGSGDGGASFFGSGGACGPIGGNTDQAGVPYGAGGGGGSNQNGGAGAGGWMIVKEYK